MRTCVTHGIADSTGIFSFFPAFGIMAFKFFNSVERNIVKFLFMTCSLCLVFFNCPFLMCFLLSTFGPRRPHFWSNRFRSRCDLRFLSIYHPPMNNLGVDICSGCGMSWIRSKFHTEYSVHQCSTNHRHCSLPNCPGWFVFASRRHCFSEELGLITLSVRTIFHWAWRGGDE